MLFQVTYNRVMSNHRSVTKPKDVKYKRINKAKSKSLEELRGRLRNWVEKGNKIAISLDQSYAWSKLKGCVCVLSYFLSDMWYSGTLFSSARRWQLKSSMCQFTLSPSCFHLADVTRSAACNINLQYIKPFGWKKYIIAFSRNSVTVTFTTKAFSNKYFKF